jgi:hypothetical protein
MKLLFLGAIFLPYVTCTSAVSIYQIPSRYPTSVQHGERCSLAYIPVVACGKSLSFAYGRPEERCPRSPPAHRRTLRATRARWTVEATAIGNILVQARGVGLVNGRREDLRRCVASAFPATYGARKVLAPSRIGGLIRVGRVTSHRSGG